MNIIRNIFLLCVFLLKMPFIKASNDEEIKIIYINSDQFLKDYKQEVKFSDFITKKFNVSYKRYLQLAQNNTKWAILVREKIQKFNYYDKRSQKVAINDKKMTELTNDSAFEENFNKSNTIGEFIKNYYKISLTVFRRSFRAGKKWATDADNKIKGMIAQAKDIIKKKGKSNHLNADYTEIEKKKEINTRKLLQVQPNKKNVTTNTNKNKQLKNKLLKNDKLDQKIKKAQQLMLKNKKRTLKNLLLSLNSINIDDNTIKLKFIKKARQPNKTIIESKKEEENDLIEQYLEENPLINMEAFESEKAIFKKNSDNPFAKLRLIYE